MSFGRCLVLLMRRLGGEEGAGWGSGLLMMMGVGADCAGGFHCFRFFYRLIDVVASFRSFRSSRRD